MWIDLYIDCYIHYHFENIDEATENDASLFSFLIIIILFLFFFINILIIMMHRRNAMKHQGKFYPGAMDDSRNIDIQVSVIIQRANVRVTCITFHNWNLEERRSSGIATWMIKVCK